MDTNNDKKRRFKKIKLLKLPKGSHIIYGATPFVIYGIRDVNDIDMLISEELYKKLKKEGWKKISKGPRDEPVTYDIFEAHKTWEFSPYAPTLSELLSRAVEVEGIAFASLEDVQKWKKASGRPKDITDLKLIDDYLVGHTDS
jgi:hypothetical protein